MSRPLGLYHPADSPLHRLAAGPKFVALLVFAALIVIFDSLVPLGSTAVVVAIGFALARIPARRVAGMLRLLVPMLAVVFGLQWWLLGFDSAALVCLRLLVALGAANLFTFTTRVEDLVAAVERGLRPARGLGVRPDRVGLLVGLTLQAVGALSVIAEQTRQAQRARNADRSLSAFAVPFLVGTLRHSEELGEALAARGVGEDDS